MAEHDPSGAERRAGRKTRPQSEPRLRHFLEDETDRYVARYFGAGRARRRASDRRHERFRRAAERQIELALGGALAPLPDHPIDTLSLVDVELNGAGSRVTVHLRSSVLRAGEVHVASTQHGDPIARTLANALRAELVVHVPRRRAPDVCVRIEGSAPAGPDGDSVTEEAAR